MADAQEQAGFAKGKDFLVLVPLLGSALAIIYDVGFFKGLDIGYFTFFSLNEHIVFALQVLPVALLFALMITGLVYVLRPIADLRRRKYIRLLLQIIAAFLATVGFAYFLPLVVAIGSGTLSLCLLLLINSTTLHERLIVASITAAVVAFWAGLIVSTPLENQSALFRYLYNLKNHGQTTTIGTKNDGTIEVRLLRSGDRGLLFYDIKNDQLMLLPWAEITRISTGPFRK